MFTPRITGILLLLVVLTGCMLSDNRSVTVVTATPNALPLPTASPVAEGWQILAPGLELRTYIPQANALAQILALRIDPAAYTFRAHYQPGQAYSLREWRDALPGVSAFVNANFFLEDHTIIGVLVSDGVIYGTSYRDERGGMFQVQNGIPHVRWLVDEPYQREPLEQAVQAFPMLIHNGTPVYADPGSDRPTRRTVVGMDDVGRVILIVTPGIGQTLSDLSVYLASTDMGLVEALNLDGGGSTMMFIGAGDSPRVMASFDPVPAVLAVYPRE